jgi:hypothetical protein
MALPKPSTSACWQRGNPMPRYFLHLRFRDGADGLAVDEEGDELSDEAALRQHVLETASDLMQTRMGAVRNWAACTFEVTDEAGHLVLTLPFSKAT